MRTEGSRSLSKVAVETRYLKAGWKLGFLHVLVKSNSDTVKLVTATGRHGVRAGMAIYLAVKVQPLGANVYIHVYPSHDVFLAIPQPGTGWYYGRRLEGFGRYILEDLKGIGVDLDDVEFSLSADLVPGYTLCSRCSGKGRIEAPGTVAGHNLSNEFDRIDFTKTGTKTCSTCRGMGVVIPKFF